MARGIGNGPGRPPGARNFKSLKEQRDLVRAIRDLGMEATRERLQQYLGWGEHKMRRHLSIAEVTGAAYSARIYVAPTDREREAAIVSSVTRYHTEAR